MSDPKDGDRLHLALPPAALRRLRALQNIGHPLKGLGFVVDKRAIDDFMEEHTIEDAAQGRETHKRTRALQTKGAAARRGQTKVPAETRQLVRTEYGNLRAAGEGRTNAARRLARKYGLSLSTALRYTKE